MSRRRCRPSDVLGWVLNCGLIAALLFPGMRIYAQDVTITLNSATKLVRSGRYDLAIAELKAAIQRSPAEPRLRLIEGLAYSLEGDDEQALKALDAALTLKPGFAAALKAEAQIMAREHRPKVFSVLTEILHADPQDRVAREMLALEQAHGGDCSSAISNFELVASILGEHPKSLVRYGDCLFSTGRFADAAATLSRAASMEPAETDLLYDIALSQLNAGDGKAAIATLTPLLNGVADVDTLTLASEAEEAIDDTPEAVALLRRAIVRDPTLADSYVRFAQLCMLHESYQAGIDMVNAGVARLPHTPSLYLARGMLAGAKGEYSSSEADFHLAELYDPKHGTGAFGVGLVQAQSNHPEEALATARDALRAHPDDARLLFLLAKVLVEGGEKPGSAAFVEATAGAERSVQLLPDFLAARNLLSKIYLLEGKLPEAVAQCRAALKLDPEDETATYRLMLLSRKTGDVATVGELSKRVASQHLQARNAETKRLRFRIVANSSNTEMPKSVVDKQLR